MLLSLEPLIYLESITNGEKILNVISGGFRLTQSVYDVLLHDEKLILYGRWQIPYAYGNHELSYGCGGVVDMYVSYY